MRIRHAETFRAVAEDHDWRVVDHFNVKLQYRTTQSNTIAFVQSKTVFVALFEFVLFTTKNGDCYELDIVTLLQQVSSPQ
jgi:hypothetical protein